MKERKVEFTRGHSVNGIWHEKGETDTFDMKTADALEAKGIVKDPTKKTKQTTKKEVA
ncbi:MAG: hypothetical protein ABXS91_10540 [Sulfurimonas sp.]